MNVPETDAPFDGEEIDTLFGDAVPVKFTSPTLAPPIVTVRLPGVNVKPAFEGVTVYEPSASPANW